ncbi:RIP metalloprotease RseP [Petroclostridium xylanilyticum]|uniref:RIP metalloprotease RseP n=1 Tax=Petroclostridium xylanilyticum TaxID=1792311 RepID=UPI000B987D0E|nr:RIP metalloprotease RseP [Petroclostridium xylanilyticum]
MTTLISAVVVFALLIFFHELGHFTIAKLVGIKVHEFAIGMGPRLAKFTKGETVYSLRAFPIGGFVMMEGEVESSKDERAFSNKPLWARIAVVAAGAIMNFILGFLIFIIILSMEPAIPQPVVGELVPGKPAEKAGILPGDRIIQLNDYKVNIQNDVRYFLDKNKDNMIKVIVLRQGQRISFQLKPELDPKYQTYIIGYNAKSVKTNFYNVISNAYYQTAFLTKVIVTSLGDLVTGKAGLNQISGPVGIVQGIGSAAKAGIGNLAFLAALISINLGIFNLLPIPALDGSKIMFLLIEGIRRKPISPEREGMVHLIGFAMLIILLIFATFNDIARIVGR